MLTPDFRDALSAFNAERVDYLVVGAFALAAHGLPRATGDIDLWIRATPANAERVHRALVAFGAPDHLVDRDDFAAPDMVVQIGVPPDRVDVITSIDGVAFDEAWNDRLMVSLDGIDVPVISRHHLLQNKRAARRPKDRVDVATLERHEQRNSKS